MATFDQRGQIVNYQYNVAGNINFGIAKNKEELAAELQKLLEEIEKAKQAGVLDADIAIDAEAAIKKAVIQSNKPEPDKNSIIECLTKGKTLIEGFKHAAELVGGINQAIEVVRVLLG